MKQTGKGFFSRFAGLAIVAGTLSGATVGLIGGGIAALVGAPALIAVGAGVAAGAAVGFGFGMIQARLMRKVDDVIKDTWDELGR